ncbi:RNA-binding protein, partial [Actinotalea ferrariae CF5-4]
EARGLRPGAPLRRRQRPTEVQMSSAARDGRDPALVGDALSRLATERGWSADLSVGGVVGRWREVVGDQLADHCTPETFDDGLLVLRTDSTAWATQVRLLVPQLLRRLEAELGPDVVRDVKVVGPAGVQWGHGQRRVAGRGPRDTYA